MHAQPDRFFHKGSLTQVFPESIQVAGALDQISEGGVVGAGDHPTAGGEVRAGLEPRADDGESALTQEAIDLHGEADGFAKR